MCKKTSITPPTNASETILTLNLSKDKAELISIAPSASDKTINTSKQENLPIVDMQLSIGQCKIIFTLLWAELSDYEDRATIFDENSLRTLYDTFEGHIKPQTVRLYHD